VQLLVNCDTCREHVCWRSHRDTVNTVCCLLCCWNVNKVFQSQVCPELTLRFSSTPKQEDGERPDWPLTHTHREKHTHTHTQLSFLPPLPPLHLSPSWWFRETASMLLYVSLFCVTMVTKETKLLVSKHVAPSSCPCVVCVGVDGEEDWGLCCLWFVRHHVAGLGLAAATAMRTLTT